MITPAYSPTATERVLPRMALDFTTGVLDPRVTVTRALNTATRVNSSGIVEGVNANLPRFDYDAVSLAAKGLLIEETRANLLLNSAAIGAASWNALSGATVSANIITAPDGTLTADKLVEDTSNGAHRTGQDVVTTAAAHTYSVFLKPAGRNFALLYTNVGNVGISVNLTTGATSAVPGLSAPTTTVITPWRDGWFRCAITFTATAATNTMFVFLCSDATTFTYTGDGTSGAYIWGAQLEAGSFATSYIPTTTTSLTRNADVVSMTGTNFSDWYNASEGSFYARGSRNNDASFSALVAVSSDASNEMYMTQTSSRAFAFIRSSAGVNGDLNGQVNSWIGGTVGSAVFAYKLNNAALAVNANSTITDTTVTIPTVNRLDIGARSNGTFMNGHIQRVSYWPQRLIDAEAQAFSKG